MQAAAVLEALQQELVAVGLILELRSHCRAAGSAPVLGQRIDNPAGHTIQVQGF